MYCVAPFCAIGIDIFQKSMQIIFKNFTAEIALFFLPGTYHSLCKNLFIKLENYSITQ